MDKQMEEKPKTSWGKKALKSLGYAAMGTLVGAFLFFVGVNIYLNVFVENAVMMTGAYALLLFATMFGGVLGALLGLAWSIEH